MLQEWSDAHSGLQCALNGGDAVLISSQKGFKIHREDTGGALFLFGTRATI